MAIRVTNVTAQVLWAGTPQILVSASNSLGLSQEVVDLVAIDDFKPISHNLNLTQEAKFGERGENELNLTQTLTFIGPRVASAENELLLQQALKFCFGTPHTAIQVTDTLNLVDLARRAHPASASDNLNLIDSVTPFSLKINQSLGLSDSAVAGFGLRLSDDLSLTDGLTVQGEFTRSVTHNNVVKQAFTYFIDNACNRKQYARFDGAGEESPLPEKRLAFNSDFVVESLTGTKTILRLRSPETDDRDRVGFNRINRETRGGELNVFRDPTWPEINTLLFTIVALKKEKIDALQDFFQDNLGQEIKLHDWTGIVWRGVVTTPEESAVEDQDGFWTLAFEFEGTPFEGQAVDDPISLSQLVEFDGSIWTRSLSNSSIVSDTASATVMTP